MNRLVLRFVAAAALVTSALAQSDVDNTHKYSWAENVGWLNWRDAASPTATSGMRLHDSFLSGFVWGENIGWINLGDGTPADGVAYGNTSGADSGVNIDPDTDELYGLAWGENVGWINFDGGAAANPPEPARIESGPGGCRLAGWVWGENIGWINLDHGTHSVALIPEACSGTLVGDMNCNGFVEVGDIGGFVLALTNPAAHAAEYPSCDIQNADTNGDGFVTVADIGAFVQLLVP